MSAIPTGYTPLPDGFYTKSDGSGPYVFDGAAMTLAATGSGGGGGGGGAVTVADGADVTQGAKADAAAASGTGSFSVVALLKGILTTLLAFVYPASTNVSSAAYEKSHILKASAGRLFSLTAYNSGVGQFYQLHDSATLPADAAVPVLSIWVPAASSFALDFGLRGRSFAAGIVVCSSSTGPTKTLGATADTYFDAQVI